MSSVRPREDTLRRAALVADVEAAGCLVVHAGGHSIALFAADGTVRGVSSRCPHMGFPLQRGTVKDGILTCHWHHARFHLASGGTFDPWADDLRVFPVELREGEVWVDVGTAADRLAHQRRRLLDGLERNLPLVIAKATLALLEDGPQTAEAFRIGLDFGTRFRVQGWGPGLTMHVCFMNLVPVLRPDDRPHALFQGLSAVARECAGVPPRFPHRPLPAPEPEAARLKRWFRELVEVRDADGAERCLVSAVEAGLGAGAVAGMLFASATDHRYLDDGHVLDFTTKALESLDHVGPDQAGPVLGSLAGVHARAQRMEEARAWRAPVDLVAILERAFDELPAALERPRKRPSGGAPDLLEILLGDDPAVAAEALLRALFEGSPPEALSAAVAHAAAVRIARFPTSNEVGDWDTALHSFTFANAVDQGLRRTGLPELVRGIFDGAMTVYLNRFLNVPAIPIPEVDGSGDDPALLLDELADLLETQGRTEEAGAIAARYATSRGDAGELLAALGALLVREDRLFHSIQMVEATVRQHGVHAGTAAATHLLVAGARYLAAHAPTARGQLQTFTIARRLQRSEQLHDA